MLDRQPVVYILASKRNGTHYVGVTSDFEGRISGHMQDLLPGFTAKYGVKDLVYLEHHGSMDEAIAREKQIKRWRRDWKIALIERANPGWRDLFSDLSGLTAALSRTGTASSP